MPLLTDYSKTIPLEARFREMSDEEFRQFAASDEAQQNYSHYSEAEKTAFLIRALMLDQDPEEFGADVITKQNNLRAEGPEGVEKAIKARTGINDPYDDARHFQYELYRELLYQRPEIRELATSVTGNMTPGAMAKNAELLRDALTGHLQIPMEAEGEIRDSIKQRLREDREKLTRQLDQGLYWPKAYTLTDPKNGFTVHFRRLEEGEDPASLLERYDGPETKAAQKLDLLVSYVLRDLTPKAAARAVRELQEKDDNKPIRELLKNYAAQMPAKELQADLDRLKQVITERSGMVAMQLIRKLDKAKEAQLKAQNPQAEAPKVHRYIPEDSVYAKELARKEKLRQQEEARKNRIQHLLDTGRRAGLAANAEGPSLDADSKGRTWAVYGDKHRPVQGRNYSREEKEVLFSKLLTARQMQRANGTDPKRKQPNTEITAFNLKTARSDAEKLRKSLIFKGLISTKGIDKALSMSDVELSDAAIGINRPFHGLSVENRDRLWGKLEKLTPLLSSGENGPEEWTRFTDSMERLAMRFPVKSDNPETNGEQELQNVLKCAVDYMKGKKSLRRNPEEQERFDQALDVVCELANATPYAKAAAQATLDRINEVRRKHNRDHRDLRLDELGADNLQSRRGPEAVNADNRPTLQAKL